MATSNRATSVFRNRSIISQPRSDTNDTQRNIINNTETSAALAALGPLSTPATTALVPLLASAAAPCTSAAPCTLATLPALVLPLALQSEALVPLALALVLGRVLLQQVGKVLCGRKGRILGQVTLGKLALVVLVGFAKAFARNLLQVQQLFLVVLVIRVVPVQVVVVKGHVAIIFAITGLIILVIIFAKVQITGVLALIFFFLRLVFVHAVGASKVHVGLQRAAVALQGQVVLPCGFAAAGVLLLLVEHLLLLKVLEEEELILAHVRLAPREELGRVHRVLLDQGGRPLGLHDGAAVLALGLLRVLEREAVQEPDECKVLQRVAIVLHGRSRQQRLAKHPHRGVEVLGQLGQLPGARLVGVAEARVALCGIVRLQSCLAILTVLGFLLAALCCLFLCSCSSRRRRIRFVVAVVVVVLLLGGILVVVAVGCVTVDLLVVLNRELWLSKQRAQLRPKAEDLGEEEEGTARKVGCADVAGLKQALDESLHAWQIRVALHRAEHNVEEHGLLGRAAKGVVKHLLIEYTIETVGHGAARVHHLPQQNERLHGCVERASVSDLEQDVHLLVKLLVVDGCKWECAVDACQQRGEQPRLHLVLDHVGLKELEVDVDEVGGDFRHFARELNLVEKANGVVLCAQADVWTAHELLDLLDDNVLHVRMGQQQSQEEVGGLGGQPAVRVAQLVHQRRQQHLLHLRLLHEELEHDADGL
eukprot:m.126482 g.126482  ORF g.126482 m.126482 type:complete len:707 (-) comp16338_c0_seq1:796-2916(-)